MKATKQIRSALCVTFILLLSACATPAAPVASDIVPTLNAPIAASATPLLPSATHVPPSSTTTAISALTQTELPPTQTPATAVAPVSAPGSLPLLYTDVAELQGARKAVTIAVTAEGSSSGIVAESFGAAWAPDGKSFAYVNAAGTELRQRTLDGQEKVLLSAGADERFRRLPAWSPDGSRIAIITRTPDRDDGKEIVVVENGTESGRYPLPALSPDHIYNPNKFRWSLDGNKILLSWDYTVVVHTESGEIETISDQRIIAEWAPDSTGVYYFELVGPAIRYGDLGSFNLKRLGESKATVLVPAEQVGALGLHTNISAFAIQTENLQFSRGLMNLSPGGSKLVIVGGIPSPDNRSKGGSRFYLYSIAPGATVALDKPEKTIQVDSSIAAVEWSPDESRLGVIAIGGTGEPDVALKVIDLDTGTGKVVAPLAFQLPTFQMIEQLNFLITVSSKILSWTQ